MSNPRKKMYLIFAQKILRNIYDEKKRNVFFPIFLLGLVLNFFKFQSGIFFIYNGPRINEKLHIFEKIIEIFTYFRNN